MQAMKIPKFVDVHPAYNTTGFKQTNEEPDLLKALILKQQFKRTAAICSGGEIPFFVLLPQSDEVIAIDHSYLSIATAFLKASILATLGPRATMSLYLDRTFKDFIAEGVKAKALMPEVLRDKVNFDPSDYPRHISSSDFDAMRCEFHYLPYSSVRKAYKFMDKVTILHGDLADLSNYGKFNCLYMSNAHEHSGRNNAPQIGKVSEIVEDDGLTIFTRSKNSTRPTEPPDGWKITKSLRGFRSQWDHVSIQRASVGV